MYRSAWHLDNPTPAGPGSWGMATKTIITTTCDMPHTSDATAMPVTITTPDGTWSVDLCPDHASALLPLVAAAPKRGTRTRVKA